MCLSVLWETEHRGYSSDSKKYVYLSVVLQVGDRDRDRRTDRDRQREGERSLELG